MFKKSLIKSTILLSSLALILGPNFKNTNDFILVKAEGGSPTYSSSLTTNINLNKTSNDEIRNYYSSLNSLSNAERSKTNLLKNNSLLSIITKTNISHSIIKNHFSFF